MLAKDREEHETGLITQTKGRFTHMLASCSACCSHRRPPPHEEPTANGTATAADDDTGLRQRRRKGGLSIRGFFMERADTLGKMVAEREKELERELEVAELETWGAKNADGLPIPTPPPSARPVSTPLLGTPWHVQQSPPLQQLQQPQLLPVLNGGGSGGGLVLPPPFPLPMIVSGAGGAAAGAGGTRTPLQEHQEQQHSVVQVRSSPHHHHRHHHPVDKGLARRLEKHNKMKSLTHTVICGCWFCPW